MVGSPIHPEAAQVIEKFGGDLSSFAAQQYSPAVASHADLVLTMTRAQREVVLETAPRQLHKTFTLPEAARLVAEFNAQSVADLAALRPNLAFGDLADIADPIGRGREIFAMVGTRIAELLPPILELCRRSSAPLAE